MRGTMAALAAALVLAGLTGLAIARNEQRDECRRQCDIARISCKQSCEVERPTGWGNESYRYEECDQDCKSDYQGCKAACNEGEYGS